MPTQKPRLNLTLDDDLNETITRLAELMGKPKASLVNFIRANATCFD